MDINTIDKKLEDLALKYGLRLKTHVNRGRDLYICAFLNDSPYLFSLHELMISHVNKEDFLSIENSLRRFIDKTTRSSATITGGLTMYTNFEIKNVIFNDLATIVFWKDGTKTVVQAHNDEFDPEKGLAMAIAKKALGNKGNYYNKIKKWLHDEKAVNDADGEN